MTALAENQWVTNPPAATTGPAAGGPSTQRAGTDNSAGATSGGATTQTRTPRGTSARGQRGQAMGTLPPKLDFDSEGNAYKIAEILQMTLQETGNWCESLANQTWPRLEAGLRDEGLDGGTRWSQLLHGGDARRTAKLIVQPLYVVQTDLLNAARSAVVFGNRSRVMYFDAIRAARQAKNRSGNAIPVE